MSIAIVGGFLLNKGIVFGCKDTIKNRQTKHSLSKELPLGHDKIQKTMFYVSELKQRPPEVFITPLQKAIYQKLEQTGILYGRVDTDPGVSMEDCLNIESGIGGHIVKTLFLCNRQQTAFYLYVTRGDKPFVTKDFCSALGIPRVSFAPEGKLHELTGANHGGSTILCACMESARDVTFVADKEVLSESFFCCTDGTPTCFVRIRTSDLRDIFLPSCGKALTII